MFQKNEEIKIEVVDIGENGEGIGKIDGFTIFVHGAIPGDTVLAKIIKTKKQYAIAKVIKILVKSDKRVTPECPKAHTCGGCQIQSIRYNEQLKIKKNIVESALVRIGGFEDIKVNETIGMEKPKAFRNKSQYPVRRDNHEIQIGFYKQRTHEVVNINNCMVQHDLVNEVMEYVRESLNELQISIYNEDKHKGFIRHIVVRISYRTKDIMLIFVTKDSSVVYDKQLLQISKKMVEKYPQIKSIIQNINSSKGNRVMGNKNITIFGENKIYDYIKDLKFEISPMSFLQVNPEQAEVLYDIALNMVNLEKSDTVFDIYCGIGTISLFLAKHAKKVYGVEVVDVAIEDAKRNAIANNIENTEFISGKAEEVIPDLYKKNIIADVIVLDPPRKGCDEIVLQTILDMEPKKICYISCKASTLARDLKILSTKYELVEVQPVDLFPMTMHVETIVKMVLKK